MQLKKRFTIKKQLAVGAVTAVMLVTSLPALASDGLGLEGRFGLHLGLSEHVHAESGDRDDSSGDRGLGAEIKDELLAVRQELKASAKLKFKGELEDADASSSDDTTSTAQVAERQQCKKEARTAFQASLAKARDERDAAQKDAQTAYLAALKSARDAFHASVSASVSASGTGEISANVSARLAYHQAVKAAQKAFRDAKKKAANDYHAETKAARAIFDASVKSCKI